MKLVMEVKQSARTKLAVRFDIYCTDLDELITMRANERNYEEADRLKQLRNSIQLLITDNKLDEHLDYIRSLVTNKGARSLSQLAIEEDKASRRQDFLSQNTGAQALRDLSQRLTKWKDALSRELDCFPRRTLISFQTKFTISYLWTAIIVDNSAFTLARLANDTQLLIQVHKLYRHPLPLAPTLSFSPKDLKANGYSASELRTLGYSIVVLKSGGYTALEMKDAGFSLHELKEVAYVADEMKAAGYTAKELKAVGYALPHLIEAGYTVAELRTARFKLSEIAIMGFNYAQLKNAGYSSSDIIQAIQILKSSGCTGSYFKSNGYPAVELKEAGFTAVELKEAGFTIPEIKIANYQKEELRAAGYWCKELKENGYTPADFRAAGYTAKDVIGQGFSIHEMREINAKTLNYRSLLSSYVRHSFKGDIR